MWGKLLGILSVPWNIVMDLSNVALCCVSRVEYYLLKAPLFMFSNVGSYG
jgi:hypothetical protein